MAIHSFGSPDDRAVLRHLAAASRQKTGLVGSMTRIHCLNAAGALSGLSVAGTSGFFIGDVSSLGLIISVRKRTFALFTPY
jgi:hypothetical protein